MWHEWVMGVAEIEYLYSTEEQSHCLADRCQAALQDGSPASLEEATVDSERAEVWGEAPDVVEGHTSKVDPPEHG